MARSERRELCELMRTLGPDAPTLCPGWTAHHLAAHLVMRESDLVGALGIMCPWLGADRSHMDSLMAGMSFDDLVDRLAAGPSALSPMRLSVLDQKLNSAEFFVHHEDLRRGGSYPVGPRILPQDTDEALWSTALSISKLRLRRAKAGIVFHRIDKGTPTDEMAAVSTGRSIVTVTAEPGELLLWLFGRDSAQVQVGGPAWALAQVRSVHLSA